MASMLTLIAACWWTGSASAAGDQAPTPRVLHHTPPGGQVSPPEAASRSDRPGQPRASAWSQERATPLDALPPIGELPEAEGQEAPDVSAPPPQRVGPVARAQRAPADLERIVRRRLHRIPACGALDADLEVILWIVSGRVEEVLIEDVDDEQVDCLAQRIQRWRFGPDRSAEIWVRAWE